jgi:hypothetical protein
MSIERKRRERQRQREMKERKRKKERERRKRGREREKKEKLVWRKKTTCTLLVGMSIQPFWKIAWRFFKILKIELLYG